MNVCGWILGILVALNAAACNEVDHPVGKADEPEPGAGGSGAGGSGANGNGGGSAGASAGSTEWGDLPIPESCTRVFSNTTEDECELEVECADDWVRSHCLMEHDYGDDVDFLGCTCNGTGDDIWYRFDHGLPLADACTNTLALCFQWPELEAGPYECEFPTDDPGTNSCSSEITCEREGTLGDQEFSESHLRVIECSSEGSGFSCSCTWPILRRFEGTTEMPSCVDARDWCAGEGVELASSPTCTTEPWPPEEDSPEDTCAVDVICERTVTVAGQEMTMSDSTWVQCSPTATSGIYGCRCLDDPDGTQVAAADAESACMLAASKCEPRR